MVSFQNSKLPLIIVFGGVRWFHFKTRDCHLLSRLAWWDGFTWELEIATYYCVWRGEMVSLQNSRLPSIIAFVVVRWFHLRTRNCHLLLCLSWWDGFISELDIAIYYHVSGFISQQEIATYLATSWSEMVSFHRSRLPCVIHRVSSGEMVSFSELHIAIYYDVSHWWDFFQNSILPPIIVLYVVKWFHFRTRYCHLLSYLPWWNVST